MKSEKTVLQAYLYASIAVLITAFVFQTRGLMEGFQTMGIPGTSVPGVAPRYVCIGSDGVSNCRFVDVSGSTADTLLIREITGSIPTYSCPKYVVNQTEVQTKWDYTTRTCSVPSGSPAPPSGGITYPYTIPASEYSKITCTKADETYISSLNKCAVVAGTLPRCLKDGATAADPEVKAAMVCYAKRYSDPDKYPSVTKLGNDTALLWNEFINLGVYNYRNPCCDAAVAPTPAGSVKIGTLVVEKDWKFWTIVGLGLLALIIGIAAVV